MGKPPYSHLLPIHYYFLPQIAPALDYTAKSILSPTDSSFSKEPIAVSLLLTLASFGKGGGTAKPWRRIGNKKQSFFSAGVIDYRISGDHAGLPWNFVFSRTAARAVPTICTPWKQIYSGTGETRHQFRIPHYEFWIVLRVVEYNFDNFQLIIPYHKIFRKKKHW